jgi:hypothetical protein
MVADKFCKSGCHEEVATVGELAEALKELPSDMPLDKYNRLPVVFNVSSKPFFKLEDKEFI